MACPRRSRRRPAARCCWRRASQRPLFPPCAAPSRSGRSIGAPYEIARVRSLIGRACQALADDDGAELEFAAARLVFADLGATPDIARVDALAATRGRAGLHGLTRRELQVLRLVSAGSSNAAIAAELSLSQRTVERHLSNIFTKLDLSSRTAAAAWIYRHGLV